ncbi:hypothetical protein MW887_004621 [Aspergillus wentii]|nr:hypothetical protein MW887_004621 [Aspergillus wentii]
MASIASVGLTEALQASPWMLAGYAAVFGLSLHVILFRPSLFIVEEYLYKLLGLYATAVIAAAFAFFTVTEFSMLQIVARVGLIALSFNTGFIFSLSLYRLFFHRLHRFPGPVASKLTRFYDAWLAGKNVQYNVEIDRLHSQYGDFIRTGPREICIVRKSAVPLLFGPQSDCLKSTYYAQASPDPKKCSVHHTRDFDDHRRRRKAWDRGFSIKALGTYEPRIKTKADLLVSHIESNIDKPLDATAWSMFLSFDIMGDVGFGKDFNNLTTGIEHPAIKGVHDHMAVLGVLGHIPWLLNVLGCIPGATAGYSGFFKWCADEIESKKKRWNSEEYPQDVVSWLLKAFVEKDVSAAPTEDCLHEDSRVVIVAGSETTATTLANALFHLAKYPAVLAKLQHLLDEAMPGGPDDWDYKKIKDMSFIDDIINETLRLRPAVMTGGYRVTPPQGIQVDEVYIPGDVNVFVPVQCIQTDERYYKQSKQFIPERWDERKQELGTEGAPFLPFLLGPYVCPGKNLAMMSLRISISTLAQKYNITFAPGETGDAFDKGALDTFTTTLPPLQMMFQPR